jgi:hypothetical protein
MDVTDSWLSNAGFLARIGLRRPAPSAIATNTLPVSPALVWGVPAVDDRDLFFQDSNVVSAGLRSAISNLIG